jgi:hypothetical protein
MGVKFFLQLCVLLRDYSLGIHRYCVSSSSGIAAVFVASDLLTSLDIYLEGGIRKSKRHDLLIRAQRGWCCCHMNSHKSVLPVLRAVLKVFL